MQGGAEVVRDWLRSLDDADRQAVGPNLMRVQYRWPVGMPLCRALGEGLWEVRTSLPSNRIARVLFSMQQGRLGPSRVHQVDPEDPAGRPRSCAPQKP
jgi:hypothetical protein